MCFIILHQMSVPAPVHVLMICVFNGRRGCLFSHNLHSGHNVQILKEHHLDHLSRAELCTLLLQSDDRLLPRVSVNRHYNVEREGVFPHHLSHLCLLWWTPDMP